VERRKMISAASLIKELDSYNLTAVPRADCLTLDTGARSAEATAREIIGHFGLGAAQNPESLQGRGTAFRRLPTSGPRRYKNS
jgi:hypothetical protein